MLIIKASGEKEKFSEEKFQRSLERAGLSPDEANNITRQILAELRPSTRTADIYRRAFQLLRKRNQLAASRYSLKRALLEFGPSGYPFENFVGALLEEDGFRVEVGKIILGKCVKHEIDIIATKNRKRLMVECKYHNEPGVRSDVKVALYVSARFHDITNFDEVWLVTNTKFTEDAIHYAECAGMRIISWNYPAGASLAQRIEKSGLHPLTCLNSLNRSQKQRLLKSGLVLSRDLEHNHDALRAIGLQGDRIALLMNEINSLSTLKSITATQIT